MGQLQGMTSETVSLGASGSEGASEQSPAIFAYLHTHWDREWYYPFRKYQVRLAETVDLILDRLDSGVFPYFTLDGQTILMDDYLALRPWNKTRLEKWIQSGYLNVGPWYVMPDEFLVGGESLVRNLKRGIETAQEWGCHEFTGYLPDTFGHSGDIPLILNHFGIDTAVIWRGVNLADSVFQWQSRNQKPVLTYFLTSGYFQNMLHDATLTPEEQQGALKSLYEDVKAHSVMSAKGDEPAIPMLLPLGGDHLGSLNQEQLARLAHALPDLEQTTPPRFLSHLKEKLKASRRTLLTLTGELRDHTAAFLLPGTYSSRLYLKQENRRLEHRVVRQTEPHAAFSQLLPGKKPFYPVKEFEIAWELMLQNHPHDSICGCSVDEVHRENEVRYDQVHQLCEALEDRQQFALNTGFVVPAAGDAQAAPEHFWLLYNDSDRPYSGPVRVREWFGLTDTAARKTTMLQTEAENTILIDDYRYDLCEVPLAHKTMRERTGWIWANHLPAHGFQVVPKTSEALSLPYDVVPVQVWEFGGTTQIENGHIRLTVQPWKENPLSVEDLRSGQVYSQLHTLRDLADQGDSYNSAPVPGMEVGLAKIEKVRSLEQGPLRASVALDYMLSGQSITTTVTLEADSPRVTFETRWTNITPDHKVQVSFGTGAPIRQVLAESHFGIETRNYDPTYQELDGMPAALNKELLANTGPIQRFVAANGELFLTEGLTEYEVYGDTLSITLLRAFGYLSKKETGVRGNHAGPPFETQEGQCLGRELVCRYGWMPMPKEIAECYHEADRFYGITSGEQGRPAYFRETIPEVSDALAQLPVENHFLVQWDNPHIVSTCVKWADSGKGLLVRLMNTGGEQELAILQAGFPYTHISEVNFLECCQGVVESSVIPFAPYTVKTLLFHVQS